MPRLFLLALALATAPALKGSLSLDTEFRTAGPAVREAFDFVQPRLQESSAVFQRGRKELIFGTVVSRDGHILTKASEMESLDGVSVVIGAETYEDPKLLATDPSWDVALVKIEAENLVPVDLSMTELPPQGTWLIANGATERDKRRVQVGVMAAKAREVFAAGGTVLGISLKEEEGVLIVEEVTEDSGAEAAGLQAGDRLVRFDGKKIEDRESLLEDLKERRAGDKVPVTLQRGEETFEVEVELSGRVDVFGEETTRNDMMSGEYSPRRTGFPRVLQHDIMGNRYFMGGPVFDLDGNCVGMNIARFSRCETYAIPAADLRSLVERMISQAGS